MSHTEVTDMHRLIEAFERVAISLERIEQRLADHPVLQLPTLIGTPIEDHRTTIRTKVDKDGDPWFELTPGLWTWADSGQTLRSAKRLAEDDPESDLVNMHEADLDESEFAPFTEANPVPRY